MLAKRLLALILLFFCMLPLSAEAANTSGLSLPRWVTLKSNEVNMRTGPGTRYPIQWVYRRAGMPVGAILALPLPAAHSQSSRTKELGSPGIP